ncbi:hypothetical protein CsSME_00024657 [Camellia sinensis var. sinensis]
MYHVSKRDVKFKVASVSSLMKPFWKVPPFWTREESSFGMNWRSLPPTDLTRWKE